MTTPATPSPAGGAKPAPPLPMIYNGFLPMLIVLLALLTWFIAMAVELRSQAEALKTLHTSQQQTVDNAAKLRGSLDALAADTQRLANAGNPNAALLVDELRRRGVTINVNPPAAAQQAASASR